MSFFYNKSKLILFLIISLFVISISIIFFVILFNPYPLKYADEINEIGLKYEIASPIIASIINAESSFNKNAKSDKGAIGLMQILPSTAEWVCSQINKDYSQNILYDPYKNIEIGTYYFKYLLKKFGDLNTALASYNAGEGNVNIWLLNSKYSKDGEKISSTPFKQTNSYIEKVIKGIDIYSKNDKLL